MGLLVAKPGLFSLVVDRGRPDRRGLGVPTGGAFDRAAYRLGNALVGNEPNAAAIEITLSGPTLEATAPCAGVLFGADFELSVNDEPWPAGMSFQLAQGDRLSIGATRRGVRAYLCAAGGGFGAPVRLGSRSAFGPVAAGALLECVESRGRPRRRLAAPWHDAMFGQLRLLPGSHLTEESKQLLAGQAFIVGEDCSRQGLRLKGKAPLPVWPAELVSAPVVPGTVQLPAGGQPIVLGADAQTIGGYPRLAHVILADQDQLAQLRPGDAVRFRWVEQPEAEAAWREREARLQELEAWLRAGAMG